jgi:hypothetical protein
MPSTFKNTVLLLACMLAAMPIVVQSAEPNDPPQADKTKPPAAGELRQKPIVQSDLEPAWVGFYHRHLLEAYQKRGQRDPRWDTEAEVFLEELAVELASAKRELIDVDLQILANGAMKAGCTDPLVRAGYLIIEHRLNSTHAPQLLEVARELAETEHLPIISAYCAGIAMQHFGSRQKFNEEKFAACAQLIVEQSRRCAVGDWVKPGEERAAYSQLKIPFEFNRIAWPDTDPTIQKMLDDAKGDAQQWFANMLAAKYCMNQGWAARGSGLAYTITPEGGRKFQDYIERMVAHLLKAYELHPNHPEAACDMIVALSTGTVDREDETPLAWFQRSVAAQPDYLPAYKMMVNFSLPRWGGSYEQMEQVGRHGLHTGRFDTWAPFQYFESLAMMAGDIPGNAQNFWETELPQYYPHLKRMFEGYQSSQVYADRGPFFHSLHAVMAFHMKQYDEALAQLRKAGDRVHSGALVYGYMTHDELVENIHALGGSAGSKILEVRKLLADEEFGEAEKLIADAVKICEGEADKPALRLAKNMAATAKLQKDLQSLEWVDLTFDEDLSGWSRFRGTWKRKDEKTVIGIPDREGLAMMLIAPVGHRLQFRGEMQISKVENVTDNTGVLLVATTKPVTRSLKFLAFPHPRQPRMYLGFSTEQAAIPALRLNSTESNEFDVGIWDRRIISRLNGGNGKRAAWLPNNEEFGEEERIGLTGSCASETAEITFRNLQIRKLSEPPPGI